MSASNAGIAIATLQRDGGALPTVRKDGDTLVFAGALDRAAVAALWRQIQPLRPGARRIELAAVSHVDSAGLALLAELVGNSEASDGVTLAGTPSGLAELCSAYRLDDGLNFAR